MRTAEGGRYSRRGMPDWRSAQRGERLVGVRAVHPRAALGEDLLVLDAEFHIDVVDRAALLLIGGASRDKRRRAKAERPGPEPRHHGSLPGRATRSMSFPACWISTACSFEPMRSCSTLAAVFPERAAAPYQT